MQCFFGRNKPKLKENIFLLFLNNHDHFLMGYASLWCCPASNLEILISILMS